ncbi:MAG TPA: bifunctional methylenetetrahydrofolate dehydrogenase/methenyltetrahydrofolate cyclohydrolase FolD [Candidatus Aminicenantes bacterium]|nr:bifunctional methylenetetrahydrofolate dehydrogenase/methenyltetrahydrofolate cyclohydrolase FolD [Candidatus Aminicenantes bacterium]
MGSWLEGKTLAKKIKEKVKNDVALYLKQRKEVPGLAAILVGENRASKIYLRTKERNCERLGIRSEILFLPEDIEVSLLKAKIEELNSREDVDSILVQLPLPSSFNAPEIIASIHPEKDVDGVHPINLGNLMMNQEGLKPCTPLGIIELLKSREIPITGKRVVIIGRSRLVGKPLAAMVTNENGTVTICHSKTENLPHISSGADILVGAIGRGAFITPEFVKPGAVVVDVGMNNLTDKSKVEQMFGQDEKRLKDLREKGYTLIGDVHPQVIDKAEFLTPVPGGVGPLTVAMLMRNTVEAFKQRRNLA